MTSQLHIKKELMHNETCKSSGLKRFRQILNEHLKHLDQSLSKSCRETY